MASQARAVCPGRRLELEVGNSGLIFTIHDSEGGQSIVYSDYTFISSGKKLEEKLLISNK